MVPIGFTYRFMIVCFLAKESGKTKEMLCDLNITAVEFVAICENRLNHLSQLVHLRQQGRMLRLWSILRLCKSICVFFLLFIKYLHLGTFYSFCLLLLSLEQIVPFLTQFLWSPKPPPWTPLIFKANQYYWPSQEQLFSVTTRPYNWYFG